MTTLQPILPQVTTFAVNANNDLYLDTDGNIAIVTDLQAVLQACQQAAKTLLGEMVLQTDQGIPYFTAVWVGVPNLSAFQNALTTSWLQVTGVVSVDNLTTKQAPVVIPGTTLTSEAVSYSATITTIFGSSNLASEIIFNG